MLDREPLLSPLAVVALRPDGLVIPGLEGQSPLPIGLAELLVLQELAAGREPGDAVDLVAARIDTDRGSLEGFVRHLTDRHLLHPAAAALVLPSEEPTPAALEQFACEPDQKLSIEVPLVLEIRPDSFVCLDHSGGVRAALSAVELHAAAQLRSPVAWRDSLRAHRGEAGPLALKEAQWNALLGRLVSAGIATLIDPAEVAGRDQGFSGVVATKEFRSYLRLTGIVDEQMAREDAEEREREARTGRTRTQVVPVAFNGQPPLSLGLIFAHAIAYKGGALEEHYRFRLDWVSENLDLIALTERPAVYLFSNYIWSTPRCREISEQVKARSPHSVTVHGGPDTPKFRVDVEEYFRAFPDVDVTVRGEGEVTVSEILEALAGHVGDGPPDLSVLSDVPGLSYRDGDSVVHTADRDRIEDLDTIPSPFLTGLFDAYGKAGNQRVTIETNRGCPYGCTFCDWGSATLSRIRKYDIDRVFAELEWCARHEMLAVGPADSNFGMLERDVSIAEKLASLRAEYGYPSMFGVSYAKNTVRHLKQIISILVDAGIVTNGILSLQTMDTDTLDAVNRTNIKLAKYEELAQEFRRSELPLFIELMVGLPGSTFASFKNDLQQCVDREVVARLAITELLVNSPMNEPSYREKFKIKVSAEPGRGDHSVVVSTSTYTEEDHHEILRLRLAYILLENFGVLRQVARFVRQETGVGEADFYDRLRTDSRARPERWPAITLVVHGGPELMAPPVSWRPVRRRGAATTS